jgi:hypothetical protein
MKFIDRSFIVIVISRLRLTTSSATVGNHNCNISYNLGCIMRVVQDPDNTINDLAGLNLDFRLKSGIRPSPFAHLNSSISARHASQASAAVQRVAIQEQVRENQADDCRV